MVPVILGVSEESLDRLIAAAKADASVVAVILFGSATSEATARDTDVAIVLYPDAERDASRKDFEYKAHSSGKRHEGLDVSVFQALPLYMRPRVLEEGQVLWTRDEDALYAVAIKTVREWEDFRPRYEMYLEAVARG